MANGFNPVFSGFLHNATHMAPYYKIFYFCEANNKKMELLDLYDNQLRMTGQIIERGQRIPNGLMIPIVAVFVYNDQGLLLIQKVSAQKGGYYATTAGHVKSGETDFVSAMLRELREEIGISASRSELHLVKIRKFDYKFTFLYTLKCDIPAESLLLQEEEVESVKWMNRNEIEQLCKDGLFQRAHYQLLLDCRDRIPFRKGKNRFIAK